MAESGGGWRDSYRGMSSDNVKGLVLAISSSLFIGASFIVKKKGLKKAASTGPRAGDDLGFAIIPTSLALDWSGGGGGSDLQSAEESEFATLEASIGFHTDCGFSYIHSRLPGHLGEFLALSGERLNGKELVAVGMAIHFVPSADSNGE
ncbi:Magnesium transporter NIPA protein [Raphanus sativus]|nr:Magnesium transporter NIPA protein [Raphanus sativus]